MRNAGLISYQGSYFKHKSPLFLVYIIGLEGFPVWEVSGRVGRKAFIAGGFNFLKQILGLTCIALPIKCTNCVPRVISSRISISSEPSGAILSTFNFLPQYSGPSNRALDEKAIMSPMCIMADHS